MTARQWVVCESVSLLSHIDQPVSPLPRDCIHQLHTDLHNVTVIAHCYMSIQHCFRNNCFTAFKQQNNATV